MNRLQRMWINQPSTSQPLHKLHGTNVLACHIPNRPGHMLIYFLSGDVISMEALSLCLSNGWLDTRKLEKSQENLDLAKKFIKVLQHEAIERDNEIHALRNQLALLEHYSKHLHTCLWDKVE